jgi:hypothetical protein
MLAALQDGNGRYFAGWDGHDEPIRQEINPEPPYTIPEMVPPMVFGSVYEANRCRAEWKLEDFDVVPWPPTREE